MAERNSLFLHQMTITKSAFWDFVGHRPFLDVNVEDHGYHLHCYLEEAFAGKAPKPFRIVYESPEVYRVLGYSDSPDLPTTTSIAQRPQVETKELKASIWQQDRILYFGARCVPTIRTQRSVYLGERNEAVDGFNDLVDEEDLEQAGEQDAQQSMAAGGEVKKLREKTIEIDIHEYQRRARGSQDDREVHYHRWCAETMEKGGAFRLKGWRKEAFGIHTFLRRRQRVADEKRAQVVIKKPDLTVSGIIQIADPSKVPEFLLHGFGRHTAFGYGMLLLSPRAPTAKS